MYPLIIIFNWIKDNENYYTAMHTRIEIWLIIFNCKTPLNSARISNETLLMIED